MRNAIQLSNGFVLTIDNAGCLGELPSDAVQCPNEVVAYFTARTSLFEQLCAGALPEVITLANFTGDAAWNAYVAGIEQAFDELGLKVPQLVGSTESNFQALQSAFSITMLGTKHFDITTNCSHWFVVGEPLVGQQVLENREKCAPLCWVYEQLREGAIQYVHPVGSGGLQKEFTKLFAEEATVSLPIDVSSGPATSVIVGSNDEKLHGYAYVEEIVFNGQK